MALLVSEMPGDAPDRLRWIDTFSGTALTYTNQTKDASFLTDLIQSSRLVSANSQTATLYS